MVGVPVARVGIAWRSVAGSAISAAMVARSRLVGEPRWSPDGRRLAWVEAFAGRADVLVAPSDGSGPPVVATADAPVRAGGGAFTWAGPDRLVIAAADGRLLTLPADGGPGTTLSAEGRAAAPACSPDGTRVAFVVETDDSCAVAVIGTDGDPPRTVSDADYAWDPAWRPDGAQLAWHEWDLPNMPWDGSQVVLAAPDGRDRRVVAGGADEAVGQPRWSPDGTRLAFVSDRRGWANVWVGDRDGADATPVLPERHEQAEPTWGPGQRSFAWSPDGAALALTRNEDGFGRLLVVRGTDVEERARGWHHDLDWGPAGIVAVRSGARTPSAVTVLDTDGRRRVVARGPVGGFEAAGLLEPVPVRWPGDDGTPIHGLLWRPTGDTEAAPPLLVDVHGGPTGQATVTWKPWPQYFASRGWAVLAPNGRGSTGYGRAYAQALAGEWGRLDVADVAAGIRHAAAQGWCDPARVAVTGGSGGALTVLLLCAHHGDLIRAGLSMYGVTDLFGLAETTHRFESRYLDRLVGVLPAAADRYRDRSAVTHAAAIRVPVLVLQGDTDPVVPLAQAERLIGAILAAGGRIETRVYEGEGHGWSQPDTITDVYERSESFLRRAVLDA
jgi:dipeptidyl aminopeptidase/acylaminoacyl peptidase